MFCSYGYENCNQADVGENQNEGRRKVLFACYVHRIGIEWAIGIITDRPVTVGLGILRK